ncbi:MAG: CsoR family transcriptional regulator, copper-sensing transcriptional repressor [Thermoanaerobacteraceae bacterium]|nr:CsoR family transcriptional regulator, copper-sensing transcriptional repressor [Thermoanaerobacteraceae bacterium]
MNEHIHQKTQEVIDRLSRIEGHIRGVKKMLEEQKECEDVLIQISAVQAALKKAAQIILEDHMEHCITGAIKEGNGEEAITKLKKALSRVI